MKKCELCNSTARMYCESDQAILCWDCDTRVHAANFLVAKHLRTLLCNSCQSPTPWTASGPKLGPTVSICQSCAAAPGTFNRSTGHAHNHDDDGEDDNEGSDDDDDDGSDENDGDNQVVPLVGTNSSSAPPPPLSSSSSSNSEDSSRRNSHSNSSLSDSACPGRPTRLELFTSFRG